MAVATTNKKLNFEFVSIFQVFDGKIIKVGGVKDGSVLLQLGKIVITENKEESVKKSM